MIRLLIYMAIVKSSHKKKNYFEVIFILEIGVEKIFLFLGSREKQNLVIQIQHKKSRSIKNPTANFKISLLNDK